VDQGEVKYSIRNCKIDRKELNIELEMEEKIRLAGVNVID
jgi:hypothetical protein